MAKMLMVIEAPANLSKEQADHLREQAEDKLGPEFAVMVLTGGITCKVIPLPVKAD